MKIGFVGLGQMGRHIALNLLKCGVDMVVSDLKTIHFSEFTSKGASATTDITMLSDADLIFMCLPDSTVVKNILTGEGGLGERLKDGQTVVDLSTINYHTAIDIAAALEENGVVFLDAPVSGMEARAKEGTLTVMCGGQRYAFDRVRPYLDYIGNKIVYAGVSGCGQLTKLINQL